MPTNRYNKAILIFCLALTFLILVMSWLIYNQGPKVRHVEFDQPIDKVNLNLSSSMALKFDRAIEQKDYTESIRFSPEVEFTASTSSQQILITLSENLNHNQTYYLSLDNVVIDTSGKTMASPFEFSFTTSTPSYAYLERSHQPSFDGPADNEDKIYIKSPGEPGGVLYSGPNIRNFAINQNYLVVTQKGERSDDIFSLNRSTGEVTNVQMPFSGTVNYLVTSPRGNTAVFTVEPDFNVVSLEHYKTLAKRLYSLDLTTNVATLLTDTDNIGIQASSVHMSPDGQMVLYSEHETNGYFITSAYNDYDPIFIGSHDTSFGFNQTSTSIYFMDRGVASEYRLTDAVVSKAESDKLLYNRLNVSGADILVNQQKYDSSDSSVNTVYKLETINSQPLELLSLSDGYALTDFSASHDGRYIQAQLSQIPCDYDNFGAASQCKSAFTRIYLIDSQELVDEFQGTNLVWLP